MPVLLNAEDTTNGKFSWVPPGMRIQGRHRGHENSQCVTACMENSLSTNAGMPISVGATAGSHTPAALRACISARPQR